MKKTYNYQIVKELLKKDNLILLSDEYLNCKQKLLCLDAEGYYVYIILSNYLMRRSVGQRFERSNDYTIKNINHYLELNNVPFKCVSSVFQSARDPLDFICCKCGTVVTTTWANVNKNDNHNRLHIICPHCGGRTESLHALILKQIFKHYYGDTIEEEKSFINPKTNKVCPTDIVNHRLKIAIEVQSQWHDFEDHKYIDEAKKNYWIQKGYTFYAIDIRDYSPLEMCQIFFDIDELPNWINYDYSNKINIKLIQDLLYDGWSVPKIAAKLEINIHRIYDAIHAKKIFYPKNYSNPKSRVDKKHKSNKCVVKSSETAVD